MKKITLLLAFFVSFFVNSQTLDQSFLVDFGPTGGTNAANTSSPDSNSNYWNNANSGADGSTVNIISTTNTSMGVTMEVTDNFEVNTSINYGPTSTDGSQLGDLSITSATQDYFYLDSGNTSGQITFKNLDTSNGYKFYVFASRPTNGIRASNYTFTGFDTFFDVYQTSDGGSGNTDIIKETQILRPNSRGIITINISINQGSFAYINALKFEEFTDMPALDIMLQQDFLIDFGPIGGTNAANTSTPDSSGNYWNNANSGDETTQVNIINSDNVATGLIMEVTNNFKVNTSVNYGPTSTDSSQLGDLSITTATQDYFYLDGGNTSGQLTFKNLDTSKGYKFYAFASRPTNGSRISNYLFSGIETYTNTYRTSDGEAGNTDIILETQIIVPNSNGEITLDISIYDGSFAYINALKVEEYSVQLVELVSITVTGNDISQSGKTSQMSAELSPSNASYPEITWSVDDVNIATIDSNGLLKPISNGSVIVTATSKYKPWVFDTKEIIISNQITDLYLSGTATENGDNIATALPMHMVNGLEKTITNIFEIYTSLSETGSLNFYSTQDVGATIYGEGASAGTLQINNIGIDPADSGSVLITVNLNDNTYTIVPIKWSVVGGSITNGFNGDDPLVYQGGGIWSNTIDFSDTTTGDSSGRFFFRANQDTNYEMVKINNTEDEVILRSEANQYGVSLEDININYGQFIFTLNLTNYTYNIECTDIDDIKISFMGSSVARGEGATNLEGYAYQYDQLLQQRNTEGSSAFYRSNISIGGNTTVDLLNRYEKDLIGDCSKYVVYGLSLGNEGIHDNGQVVFDQFKENMQILIHKAVNDGKIPVIMNNYARADYNSTDYDFIKQMNLLIGQWDYPSVNLLGAIDDGLGRWASGYQQDTHHPNTAGHTELMYAIVPSLFDALEANKPQPVFTDATSITINNSSEVLKFTPENILHPFTISIDFKTNSTGQIVSYVTDSGEEGYVSLTENGNLKYTSTSGSYVVDPSVINDRDWHNITLTHYYAWGRTLMYRDATLVGILSEKLETNYFKLHNETGAPNSISYRNWFVYRSGMSAEEISALYGKTLLKSSLELYAPLDGEGILSSDPYVNLAQSTNEIDVTNFSLSVEKNNLNNIRIYPNPVNETLYIKLAKNEKTQQIKVYGITGKLIKTVESVDNIDFRLFSPGLYFIEVKTSKEIYTLKVVKE